MRKFGAIQKVVCAILVAYTLILLIKNDVLLKPLKRALSTIGEGCRYIRLLALKGTFWLKQKAKNLIEFKGNRHIEIHISPYGESLLYPHLSNLITKLWEIEGVEIISMQSNGLLLDRVQIKKLEQVNLTRINISLNTLKNKKANYLCGCENYNVDKLKNNIDVLLGTKINILLAPVWFPKENDKDTP